MKPVQPSSPIPPDVRALGFVSLFMDSSSELIHSLLPLFLVTTLGAGMLSIGLIEGIAEATATIIKGFSGLLSDFLKKRKFLAVLGYGLSTLSKFIFPLADSILAVFSARFTDRLGKGIRGAPRDALIADITPANLRGAAYGLRQALDSVGAVLGPVLAILGMLVFAGHLRTVLWFAVIPASISLAILITAVHEPSAVSHKEARAFHFKHLHQFPHAYYRVLIFAFLFAMARFSEAFLILKAGISGFSLAWIPLIMVVMNIFYSLSAYPAGRAADHISSQKLIGLSIFFLILADLCFAFSRSAGLTLFGAALWGTHMAFSQGTLSRLVANTSPSSLRGSAFGFYHLVTGLAALGASLSAGFLWSRYSPSATFIASAVLALMALIAVPGIRERSTEDQSLAPDTQTQRQMKRTEE